MNSIDRKTQARNRLQQEQLRQLLQLEKEQEEPEKEQQQQQLEIEQRQQHQAEAAAHPGPFSTTPGSCSAAGAMEVDPWMMLTEEDIATSLTFGFPSPLATSPMLSHPLTPEANYFSGVPPDLHVSHVSTGQQLPGQPDLSATQPILTTSPDEVLAIGSNAPQYRHNSITGHSSLATHNPYLLHDTTIRGIFSPPSTSNDTLPSSCAAVSRPPPSVREEDHQKGLNTALFLAAENGHAGVVRALVQSGANLAAIDDRGNSALHLAMLGKHKDVVITLLKHQVKRELENHDGFTPL